MLILILPLVAFSQKVVSVVVEGNKYVPDELVKEVILTREGTTFSLDKVRKDIRRLFRTGFFKRVEVYKEETEGGVRLIYKVEDLPVIYKIEFEGNKELDDEDLSQELGVETELGKLDTDELIAQYTSSPAIEERLELQRKLKLGRVFSQKDIQMLIHRIKEIYAREGFPDVEVRYKIVAKKGASKLVFIIDEKEKSYVIFREFKGNLTFDDETLADIIQTQDRNIFIFRNKPPFHPEVVEDDAKQIEEFYKSEGFLEVRVSYVVDKVNGGHNVVFLIEEGPRYKLGKVEIEGNKLYAESELKGSILEKNRRKGNYFRRAVLEALKKHIKDLYAEIGFANAHVEEHLHVDASKKVVNVKLRVEEGKPVYVNRIKVEGNYETRDYVIRREMRVQEGELVLKRALARSRERIINLGYYEDVTIEPFPVGRDRWDLLAKIRERFTGQFSVGLSYNEVTKLSGFVNLRKGNFLGTGDIAGVSVSYGVNYKDNSISYTDKWFMNKPVDLTWSVFDRRIKYVTYTVARTGGSATFSREFWEYWRWSAGLSVQRVVYSDIDENASGYIRAQEGSRQTRKLNFSLSRDTRDFFLFPSKGSYARVFYSVAVAVLGGTEKFHKVEVTASKFLKDDWFDTGLLFSFKGTFGFVNPYGGKEVPIDERFFVGGDFTIRGYNYGMAGTLDQNNDPIGSTRELFFNFEVNKKIKGIFYGAVFYDFGTGADSFEGLKPSNWKGGYGFGIRLITPMAPIKIDLAWKTKKVPGDTSPSRIHFIIGSFF